MSLRLAAISCILLGLAGRARAQCGDPLRPAVELVAGGARESPAGSTALDASALAAIAAALGVGLGHSGIAVCAGGPVARRVARVELSAAGELFRIEVVDDITHKRLQRELPLGPLPQDSRALALAVYVEELLQASWAELALARHAYLSERAARAPQAVRRELARALPQPEAPPPAPRWQLSAAANAAAHGGGLLQLGVGLGAGVRVAPWLALDLRGSYRHSPSVRASHGWIGAQALAAGARLEPRLQLSAALELRLPQAVELQRVRFTPQPDRGAGGRAATRAAVLISHGIGPAISLARGVALFVVAQLCWALLPARASDDANVATGLSGLGAQLEVGLDAAF